ncbi:MAG: response regulator [Rhodospirillaceae bacterium]|nr:response regulator [Rhodospirillaceae bacterium]
MLKSSGLSTIEVLVCDDDTVILRIMEHILSELGIGRVQSTSNPKTALQLLKEPVAKPFDIFVCDWKMPEMSGIELLRRVRALGMSTQFVMLTGNATPEAVSEAVELGVDAYIAKPFTAEQVQQKITTVAKRVLAKR